MKRNRISLKEAKRLALIKWELIVANKGNSDIEEPEEIKYLIHSCGFCQRYRTGSGKYTRSECEKCECKKAFGGTCNSFHGLDLYSCWCDCQTTENAQAVLDAIKSIDTSAWYDIRKYFKKIKL